MHERVQAKSRSSTLSIAPAGEFDATCYRPLRLAPVREEVPAINAPLRAVKCRGPDADAPCGLLDHPSSLAFWEQAEGRAPLPAVSSVRILDSTTQK